MTVDGETRSQQHTQDVVGLVTCRVVEAWGLECGDKGSDRVDQSFVWPSHTLV